MRRAGLGRHALMAPLLALTLVACEQPDMANQPRVDTYEPTPAFSDGRAARPIPDGTVARDGGEPTTIPAHNPLPINRATLDHGRHQFEVFCAPCHGRNGKGRGVIVQRGFPAPPSYHSARLRDADDAHFYRVIRDGYGAMYPYASRVAPRDRWAIIAYIRSLQFSQHARPEDVPADRWPLPAPRKVTP